MRHLQFNANGALLLHVSMQAQISYRLFTERTYATSRYVFYCFVGFFICSIQFVGPAKRNKLDDLNRQLKILNTQGQSDNLSTNSAGMSAKELVKAEIDNIVASECLYCGENMIRNIDKPFIEEHEYEKIMKEWE